MCYLQSHIYKFLGLDVAGCRDRCVGHWVEDDNINVSAYMYVQRFSMLLGSGSSGSTAYGCSVECKKTHPTEEGCVCI